MLLPQWRMAPVVEALQALRGVSLVTAVITVAEIGDLTRFTNPRQLMAYLGLVPSEHSSGPYRRLGAITKAGRTYPFLDNRKSCPTLNSTNFHLQ
jgi:transposase